MLPFSDCASLNNNKTDDNLTVLTNQPQENVSRVAWKHVTMVLFSLLQSQYLYLHQCIMDSLEPKTAPSENLYENSDMIYANATALREFERANSSVWMWQFVSLQEHVNIYFMMWSHTSTSTTLTDDVKHFQMYIDHTTKLPDVNFICLQKEIHNFLIF